jgi:hypothetical protein
VTPEEKAAGCLSPQNLLTAVVALAEDGLVVLEEAIEGKHLDVINDRMVHDVDDVVKRPTTHFK